MLNSALFFFLNSALVKTSKITYWSTSITVISLFVFPYACFPQMSGDSWLESQFTIKGNKGDEVLI